MSNPENLGGRCRVSARVLLASTKTLALERVRVQCPLSPHDRTGTECSKCDRFAGWGVSTAGGLLLACRLPCSCCASADHDGVEVFEAVFCDECRERADAAEDDYELGAGG